MNPFLKPEARAYIEAKIGRTIPDDEWPEYADRLLITFIEKLDVAILYGIDAALGLEKGGPQK